MSDDIVAFIRARLDEDEQLAVAAAGPHRYRPRWEADLWFDGTGERMDLHAGPGGYLTNQGALERPIAEHAARHDPARVLREVDAIRSIAGLHAPIDGVCPECRYRRPGTPAPAPCSTLRLLALPYADHPDYRQEWAP